MNHQWTVILTATKQSLTKPYAYFMRCTASAEEDNLSPFDSNNVCLHQSIEINNNKHSGLNARWPYGRADEFTFLAWSSIAQSVCQRAFRLLAIWCLRPSVRILHSAEEDNVSPFDSNTFRLCQSIDIKSNKYNKTKLNKTICIFMGCTTSAQMAPYGHKDPYYWLEARLMPVLSLKYSYDFSQ